MTATAADDSAPVPGRRPKEQPRRFQWMNERAVGSAAYRPTDVEHAANIVTHGVCVLPSLVASLVLFRRSSHDLQWLAAAVYGATLVLIFTVSTVFHAVFYYKGDRFLKDVLHRFDRAMIYIFIAGSYFPWLTLHPIPQEGWAPTMRWLVWCLATCGIIYQQMYHEKYKWLETLFYFLMGFGPILPFLLEHEFSGMEEIKAGGLLYIVGVVFFKMDGRVPFAHAIWHLFVAVAAGIHYFAVLHHLFPSSSPHHHHHHHHHHPELAGIYT